MLFHEWSLKPKDNNENKHAAPAIFFHSIKYDNNCLYVWIGDSNCKQENLSCAMQTNYSSSPLATEILQINCAEQVTTNPSSDLATKLAKKLNKQVFVSLNVPFDSVEFDENDNNVSVQQAMERCLFEEIKSHPDMFWCSFILFSWFYFFFQ